MVGARIVTALVTLGATAVVGALPEETCIGAQQPGGRAASSVNLHCAGEETGTVRDRGVLIGEAMFGHGLPLWVQRRSWPDSYRPVKLATPTAIYRLSIKGKDQPSKICKVYLNGASK